jgi:hypothetical protein
MFSDQAVATICARDVSCGEYPDPATCALNVLPFLYPQLIADLDSGKVIFDTGAAADCIAFLGAIQGCSRTMFFNVFEPPQCNGVFKGTLADGAACFDPVECVSGTCDTSGCSQDAVCCAGTCGPTLPMLPLGADCSDSRNGTCAAGTFCIPDVNGGQPTCGPRLAEGQPCVGGTDSCDFGLECDRNSTSTYVCGHLAAEGDSCGQYIGCDSITDFCDPVTLRCKPKIAPGGGCTQMLGCADYATCNLMTLVCEARRGVGEACPVVSDCADTLSCLGGRCTQTQTPVCM